MAIKNLGKKGISDILVSLFKILLGIAAVVLIYFAIVNYSNLTADNIGDMLKARDWDQDGIKDIVDKCACGSMQDEPQDLLGDNKVYCTVSYKPEDVCTSKYTFNKWAELKGICYYAKDDCIQFILDEYKKEAEAKDNK
jgi:hypothetical protein